MQYHQVSVKYLKSIKYLNNTLKKITTTCSNDCISCQQIPRPN